MDNLFELQELIRNEYKVVVPYTSLKEALTHSSLSNGKPNSGPHNEKLEFLGDSVLSLAVTEMLLTFFDSDDEGALSRRRSFLVSNRTLATIASDLGLNRFLRTNGNEIQPSMLAGAFEALVGAIEREVGFLSAAAFVRQVYLARKTLFDAADPQQVRDPKTMLQEILHERGQHPPEYVVMSVRGPEHKPEFRVAVAVGESIIHGDGSSKREAEQNAARRALEFVGAIPEAK